MIVSMFLPIAGLLGGKIGKDSIHYSPHCQDVLRGVAPPSPSILSFWFLEFLSSEVLPYLS